MSGGSFNYEYCRVRDWYCGQMKDMELNDLMDDLVEILHDLEWYESGDYSDDTYFETVAKFKEKWFQSDRDERLYKLIDKKIDEFREECKRLTGLSEK
jgi:hypothetical protein